MRIQAGAAALVSATLLAAAMAGPLAAAGNTIRIDPASPSVASGGTVTVKVIQNATIPTSGTQVTLTFDKDKVQVVSVTRGAPFAAATLFLAADPTAIAKANKSGKLEVVSAAFLPPASVPAGDQEFLSIELKATGCGEVKLGLPVGKAGASMLDGRSATYAAVVKVAATGATLTITGCSTGGGGTTATTAPGAAGAPTPTGAVLGETASPDPSASIDPNAVIPEESLPVDEATPGAPEEGPAAGDGVPVAAVADARSDRQAWLDVALAALAVAAVALALLILVIVAVAMIGSLIGLIVLVRSSRRPTAAGPGPSPAPEEPEVGDPAGYEEHPSAYDAEPGNDGGDAGWDGDPAMDTGLPPAPDPGRPA